jgi:predicted deacylase
VSADPSDLHGTALENAQRVHLPLTGGPDGAPAHLALWLLVGRRRRPRVTVTAGVHGDEFEGVRALMRLARELDPSLLEGTVVLAPVVNPYAYRAGTRVAPQDGVNLNRVFPGNPHGLPSERLANLVMERLVLGSDLLVDLHSGGTKLLHAPVAGYYDLPGDVGERSRAAAAAMGLAHLWNLPHRRGVLSFEAALAGVPAVGTEIGGAGRCLDADVERTCRAVLGALASAGVLGSAHQARLHASVEPPQVVSGDWLAADASGFLDLAVAMHERVRGGQPLGAVLDTHGQRVTEIEAPWSGTVLGTRTFPSVTAGELILFVPRDGELRIEPTSSG